MFIDSPALHRYHVGMTRSFLAIVIAALAAMLLPDGARAQDSCQRSVPPTVSFADATGGALSGHCVVIEGTVAGRLLVEDDRARYRREREANTPSSTSAVLGYYGDTYFDQPTRVRVLGIVSDCEAGRLAAQAADPQAIVMMSGYCHYFRGRVIIARSVENLGPAHPVRQLRTDATVDLGNLSPLADGDVRRQMERAAAAFGLAIQAESRAAIAAMHGGGASGARSPAQLAAVEQLIFDDAASPFAALRGEGAMSVEIFGWRAPLWADAQWHAERARTGTAQAIACLSRHPDAAALWPIDSKDADNRPGRPYACTRIIIAGTGADAPASFDTEQARTGVAEPR